MRRLSRSRPAGGVGQGRLGLESAAEHPEQRQLADVRIAERLEHQRGHRGLGVRRPVGLLLGLEVGAAHVAAIEGRGKDSTSRSSSAARPDRLGDGRRQHWHQLAGRDPGAQPLSISASPSEPSSRYLLSKSSSVSAAASTSFRGTPWPGRPRQPVPFGVAIRIGGLHLDGRRTRKPLSPMGIWSGTRRASSLRATDPGCGRSRNVRGRGLITARGSRARWRTSRPSRSAPAPRPRRRPPRWRPRPPAGRPGVGDEVAYPGVSTRLMRWPFQSQ